MVWVLQEWVDHSGSILGLFHKPQDAEKHVEEYLYEKDIDDQDWRVDKVRDGEIWLICEETPWHSFQMTRWEIS